MWKQCKGLSSYSLTSREHKFVDTLRRISFGLASELVAMNESIDHHEQHHTIDNHGIMSKNISSIHSKIAVKMTVTVYLGRY